ncbi:PEP-CTERM sorting domain-containing protein [Oscillatoria sp. FACHB-1406]|uniref:PEP-CTERM sorting domain-containing protein n=1 Tax=Oscillatoria sp. FACHB-1406 TaxID=2692846 RepID=UPI0016849358|nr:PEP-CTERM sorting domain-containing protein [Oscillatoria sp. FACHB-1406]MBD2579899.1 PEP-CTERM sorting domain-containing protein [Oscillatoria sp. FACHB-1406]
MSNRQLALVALTTATLAFHTPATLAYTLFQDSQTAANGSYEKTWISPVDASVSFNTLLSNMTGNLNASIWIDGAKVSSSNYELTNPNNPGKLEISSTLDVKVGSRISFRVQPQGTFDFNAKIDLSENSGLIYIGEKDRPFSHVGFNWNGQVYESSAPYTLGQYWDLVQNRYRTITHDDGVQQQHSFGSFVSNLLNSPFSTEKRVEYLKIPDFWGDNYAEKMKSYIETQFNSTYAYSVGSPAFLDPYQQKCYYGQCTGVGLIERASEEAFINDGQGFIPRNLEFIEFNNSFIGPNLDATPWECLITFPMTPECKKFADRGTGGTGISVLSAPFQHYSIPKLNAEYKDWLQGWFYNIDFMLTDPLGNKLSYRDGAWTQTGEIPGLFYTATGSDRHFLIPQRLQGNYSLEFFGKGLCEENAIAVMGDKNGGTLISGCKDPEAPIQPPTDPGKSVPEPSTLFGITMLSLFGIQNRKKIRKS